MDISDLRSTVRGKVIVAEDPEYDTARSVFYGGIDRRPAAIVRVAGPGDIAAAITFARAEKLELAVRSGGHSVNGYGVSDGGIVIDLRDLRQLGIDPERKTAWAEPGLTAGEVTTELDKHNLVLGFGDTGSVGIGGITLGGGIGYLVRKFGMTIDNLLGARIVTADGTLLEVDADDHPDLFWALRGGGGNFGVVTGFKYILHPLGDAYGGMMLLPATPEVIAGLVDIAGKAPDELSMIINVMPAFPMPFIPSQYHGKLSVMVLAMYAGPPQEGEKAVAPILALAPPIADMVRKLRYREMFMPEDASYHPKAVSRNLFMDRMDPNLATEIVHRLNTSDAQMKVAQIRVLAGAMGRIPSDATAFAHRKYPIMVNVAAFYGTQEEKDRRQQWADDFAGVLGGEGKGAYVGFMGPSEAMRIGDAYPESTLQRLREIKKRYDPENIFRLNINIPPTG